MLNLILIFIAVYFVAKLIDSMARASNKPTITSKPACPPHSWSWVKVYNDDGSVNHQHIVCAKCGPLHGVSDEQA